MRRDTTPSSFSRVGVLHVAGAVLALFVSCYQPLSARWHWPTMPSACSCCWIFAFASTRRRIRGALCAGAGSIEFAVSRRWLCCGWAHAPARSGAADFSGVSLDAASSAPPVWEPGRGTFTVVALVAVLLVVLSSTAILQGKTNPESNIKTGQDALWWAHSTIATVGYGDNYPVTGAGRLIATALMTVGVGLFETFTGFLTSWFAAGQQAAMPAPAEPNATAIPEA